MKDDIDWHEEIAAFDANAANEENRIMWLKMARLFSSIAADHNDWVESPEDATTCMAYAARAEACFSRATGDEDAIDASLFIPELAASKDQDHE